MSGAVSRLSQAQLVHPQNEFAQEKNHVLVQMWDEAGSCLGGVLGRCWQVPHCSEMSPAATCHMASNSTIREVCPWAPIRDFFGHGVSVEASPREDTPTPSPYSPLSAGQPAQGLAVEGGFMIWGVS